MTNEEILKRMSEIIIESKEKISNPPVELVLSEDNNYIYKELYSEYKKLLDMKVSRNLLSPSEKNKLDQLAYIKDKLSFMEKKASNSKSFIKLLPVDVDDYSSSYNLSHDLSDELSFVLSSFDLSSYPSLAVSNLRSNNKRTGNKSVPDIDSFIDSSVSIKSSRPFIENFSSTGTDGLKENLEEKSKEKDALEQIDQQHDSNSSLNSDKPSHLSLMDALNVPSKPSKLLDDLADIDRILSSFDTSKELSNASINDSDDEIPSLSKENVVSLEEKDEKQRDSDFNSNLSNENIKEKSNLDDSVENQSSNKYEALSDLSIGNVISPFSETVSYNDSSFIASPESSYTVLSFVALDDNDRVIHSSNSSSFKKFASSYPSLNILFVVTSTSDDSHPASFASPSLFHLV